MLKVALLGEYFSNDYFPMRGILQSILRNYCESINTECLFYQSSCKSIRDISSVCEESDLIAINLDSNYEKLAFEYLLTTKITKPVIAISTELFDIFSHKSMYPFFNMTGGYLKSKIDKYGLKNVIDLTISGSLHPLDDNIPHIYYPYLYAPSVYDDKITFMREVLRSGCKIADGRSSICSVYKYGNEFRDRVCDILEKSNKVNYGGKWRNNDDRVKFDYDFDLLHEYYNKFKYVVAIENDFHPGWITEKIINPLLVGCIPIYYAPFEFPEIINPDACVVVTDEMLYKDENLLLKQLEIDRSGINVFTENATEVFEELISDINKKIDKLLC